MENTENNKDEQFQTSAQNDREDSAQAATAATATQTVQTLPPHQEMAGPTAPDPATIAAIRTSGNWFYWIAGLSLVNTLGALFNSSFNFVIGLGITQLLDAALVEFGSIAAMIVVPVNIAIAGVYCVFGYFSCRFAKWAFVVGLIFYGLDTLLFLLVKEWFGLAFHVFALFSIYRGLKLLNQTPNV